MSIQAILESAILAPSGDNCQPWQFVVSGSRIDIFNRPERDRSLFNFRQKASCVAHGAVIENMLISSAALGYEATLKLLPDKANPDHIAVVELKGSSPKDEPLYPYISGRTTNRKIFKDLPLTSDQRNALLNARLPVGAGEVKLLEGMEEKAMVADAVTVTDRLLFQNPVLHAFLFEHIRWNADEARRKRDGLYIKTLELSPPDELVFRLFKRWPVVNLLNKVGLPAIAASKSRKLWRSAPAVGAVMINGNSCEDFLVGGRVVQRVWLEATRLGLSFQPMTGITFLIQRMLEGEVDDLSKSQAGQIMKAREIIDQAFGVAGRTVVMLFRVGCSEPPSARSLRLPVGEVVRHL